MVLIATTTTTTTPPTWINKYFANNITEYWNYKHVLISPPLLLSISIQIVCCGAAASDGLILTTNQAFVYKICVYKTAKNNFKKQN